MVRAPALPIQSYLALSNAAALEVAGESSLSPADPRVRCALAIGSPSLLDALDRTRADDKDAARLRTKLRRFLVRMSTRPTPYGMFAGAVAAGWGKTTDICLSSAPRTRTRVDMDWLLRFVLKLEMQPTIRNQLRWIASTAAWYHHGRLALAERVPPLVGGSPTRISVAAKPLVRRAMELARHPISHDALVDRLVADFPSATPEKIDRVLQQLWENGFILTELLPPLTIEDPIKWVRDRVAPMMGGKALCVQLDALLHSIAACDAEPIDRVPGLLRKAAAHVIALGQTQTEMPLQVDLAFVTTAESISSIVADEAVRAAELLFRLTPLPDGMPNVATYRQAFIARYGADREVPLLELQDHEWGLGPIGQYGWGAGGMEAGRANRRAEVLQQLAINAIHNRELAVELDEDLLRRLEAPPIPADRLPTSIDLNLFVLASSSEAIDAGQFQIMLGPNLGAPIAGRNLARFAHLLGPKACAALDRAARVEEEHHPTQITAEVVNLPRNFRYANVVVRPAVRRYEINLGVSAGVGPEYVIPLNELAVGVRQGRFYVRWVHRDVEVLFAAGHMLNSNQSSPECHFLSEVSRDGMAQLSAFSWGSASGYPFLPRVQSGRIILQCAQWRLEPRMHGRVSLDQSKQFAAWVARWRNQWRVPRRVYMSWADNRLLYDLDDPEQVDDLRGELVRKKGHGQCILQEALPSPEHAWLPSVDGSRRIVELVVSLGLRSVPANIARDAVAGLHPRPASPIASDVRLRPPGSDWLFLKLYGPRSGENDLLAGQIRRLCQEIHQARLADGWFFLRYADPDAHLRLRFFGAPEQLTGILLPRLCAWASGLIADGRCQKFGFDTYDREVERYGGPEAAGASEALFTADTLLVVELLACAPLLERTLLAVVTIDRLLGALGLDNGKRLAWLKKMVASRKEVADEYRARRSSLVTALCDPSKLGSPIVDALSQLTSTLAPIVETLAKLESAHALTQPLSTLYDSYVHMHCNRLGVDPALERRVLGLLLRARETIAHLPAIVSPDEAASFAGNKA
ncbi:MAG TPA: lantibiotic dehydratase [Candidatus Acidoferrum sp.]|nr:lantibiotic dehydratase [Candidatus Acidoferrum sp.]